MQKITDKLDEDKSRVRLIAAGSTYPIRMYERDKYKILAATTICRVAVDYCGADIEENESAFIECSKLLLQKFGGLGISEVSEAFSLAVIGKLGEINLKAYKGVFTVAMFGEVLTAYTVYRNRILNEIKEELKREELLERERKMKDRMEVARKWVKEKFSALKIENCEISKVSEVPGWWCAILSDEGLINGDPAMWILAKKKTCERFVSEYKARNGDLMFSVIERAKIVSEIEADENHFPEKLRERAEVLYGRILIFKQLAKFNEKV